MPAPHGGVAAPSTTPAPNYSARSVALLTRRAWQGPGDPPAAASPQFTGLSAASVVGLSRRALREGGVRALVWRSLAAAGVRRMAVECQLEDSSFRVHHVPGVVTRCLSEADLDSYRALRPETPRDEVIRRLRAGDQCLGAWRGDRLIANRWLATGEAKVPYLGLAFPLAPGVAYQYDLFTAPDDRGGGVNQVLGARARAMGVGNLLSLMLPDNRLGRGLAHRRSRRLGLVVTVCLGPWRLVHARIAPGYVGAPRPLGGPCPR